ncbi:MAG: hypothetical protein O2787_07695, partial [Cyanobacteria bacterium]|nr:hypothetical protein [Cyanobacteriota bacterium]
MSPQLHGCRFLFLGFETASDYVCLNQTNCHFYLSISRFSKIWEPYKDSVDLHWVEGITENLSRTKMGFHTLAELKASSGIDRPLLTPVSRTPPITPGPF